MEVGAKGTNDKYGPDGVDANADAGFSGTVLCRLDTVGLNSIVEESKPVSFAAAGCGTSEDGCESFEREAPTKKPNAFFSAYFESKEKGIPFNPKEGLANYLYPTFDLLKGSESDKIILDMDDLHGNMIRLAKFLNDFGIEACDLKATVGPRITLYEITLAPGSKASRLRGLEDDIALAMCSHNVHVMVPVPGRGTIGIEVPRHTPLKVSVRNIFDTRSFKDASMELPCAIGKTITNETFLFDLTQCPHVLIAGSTGQGKSVTINVMITSLLYKKHPASMKLVLMDPCGLEFGPFEKLEDHFLASFSGERSVISDSDHAVSALDCLCKEMEERYELLGKARAFNILDYNCKFVNYEISPLDGHKYLPYIVVVIDEYGYFIEDKGTDFEQPLTRLAQYAGKVGIHLVISTNRIGSDIITSSIRGIFPTRIAFRVPDRFRSQVILDCSGAEKLLGEGDMLFLSSKGFECVRIHGAYIDAYEVESINHFISQQVGYLRPYELKDPNNDFDHVVVDDCSFGFDSLLEEAARHVVLTQQGSTSMIQRRFSIGYNRAGRLMDLMEKAGIVGPAQGSRPRDVIIADEYSLMDLLSKLRHRGIL